MCEHAGGGAGGGGESLGADREITCMLMEGHKCLGIDRDITCMSFIIKTRMGRHKQTV